MGYRILVVLALVALAGCLGGAQSVPEATPTSTAASADASDVRVTGLGRHDNTTAGEVRISFSARNDGDTTVRNATATVALLNGSEAIATRTILLGTLAPDESASVSVTFDADPMQVDGRRVTFGTA
jgi:hypothetical protein